MTIGKRQRLGWVGAWLVGLAAAVGSCAGGTADSSPVAGGMVSGTVAGCEVGRAPLALGEGVFPYIEPEDLLRIGSDFLVVGTPSYTWAPGTEGDSLPLTTEAHIAARFTLGGRAVLIEKPIADHIGGVRALPLGGDRWGILFDQVVPGSSTQVTRSFGLWYAEHDGARWSVLEAVPFPDQGRLDFFSSSEMVRVEGDLVWVVPVRQTAGQTELLQYERRSDGWHSEVISGDIVEVATLAYEPGSGLWLAHFSEDPGLPEWQQSLRLYRRGAGWELVRRVAVMPVGAKVVDPSIAIFPDGVTVSWRVESGVDDGAYAMVGIGADGGGTTLRLDPRVLQVMSLRPPDGRPAWIVQHHDDSGSVELRLLRRRPPFEADVVASTSSPYSAFLASLALAPSEALIVGPQVSSDPADPYVRSLILRLSPSCT